MQNMELIYQNMDNLVIHVQPGQNLQEAISSAPAGSTLSLAAGTWREKIVITTPGLTLRGEGMDKTRIVYDDYAKKTGADGKELVTFRTYTVAVCADGVTFSDLAIVNDALHPEEKGQEVALTVYGDAFTAENCLLSSTQDTLFAGPLPPDLIARYDGFLMDILRADKPCRQVYRQCRIEGTVDFIFGCADALFDRCEIRSVYDVRGHGYVAAPSHTAAQRRGFVFRECAFIRDPRVVDGIIYLARPWRDYGLCSFQDCTYDTHISPLGFDHWNGTERENTARFFETPAVPGRVDWCNRPERLPED